MNKTNEKLRILCSHNGYITPVDMMGPIVQPKLVSKASVIKMLMLGYNVEEVVKGSKTKIKLTLSNINDPNRYGKKDESIVNPVVRPGVTNNTNKKAVTTELNSTSKVFTPKEEKEVESTTASETTTTTTNDTTTKNENLAKNYEFTYKPDGTVDETNIDWNSFSKSERRALRSRIIKENLKSNVIDTSGEITL